MNVRLSVDWYWKMEIYGNMGRYSHWVSVSSVVRLSCIVMFDVNRSRVMRKTFKGPTRGARQTGKLKR